MFGMKRAVIVVAAVAAAGVSAETANAQRGHYHAPGYYGGGRSFSFSFNSGPRTSYYAPSYGYGYSAFEPSYEYSSYGYSSYGHTPYGHAPYVPAYGYPSYGGPPAYGAIYGRPRGELKYDVYTPYGRSEVEYEFKRDGRVEFDIDD